MKRKGDEYEAVVLGSGLGGLIAATLLSAENQRVLIFKEKRYHPSFTKEGFQFFPFSNFSERRVRLTLLQKVSQALNLSSLTDDGRDGRKAGKRLERPKQKVAFQVILPEARVDLFCQDSIFQREWKRAFPNEVTQIENFYHEMGRIQPLLRRMESRGGFGSIFPLRSSLISRVFPYRSLPRKRIDERLSPFSKPFREFIQLQLMACGNLYSNQFPLYLVAYLLLRDETEEWIENINLERMEKSIVEKYIQSGGKIEEIEGVEKVEIGWRRFTIKLKGEERTIRSKRFIFNSPLHHLPYLLGRRERRLSKWKEKIQPRYAILPTFLGIDEKVIPIGMRDLLVSLLDLEKPYEGGNLLFLALSQKGDKAAAPEGKRTLTVESLMPVERWDQSSLEEHLKGVMRHLHSLFPFLEKNIEFTEWSWAKGQLLCWSYPHFLYETNHDFKWGDAVVPNRLSKNLFFIGKENFPYLGLEGEMLSGWMVGKQILEKYH